MDPILFLASQARLDRDTGNTSQSEIDTLYNQPGLEFFATMSRWRARLNVAQSRRREDQTSPVNFAPEALRG